MELHRRHPSYGWVALFIITGLVSIWASQNGWELQLLFIPLGSTPLLIFGLIAVSSAVGAVAVSFRPGPLVIKQAGLRVRTAGINMVIPWAAVDALVLEPYVDGNVSTARLVLIPAPGVDLGVRAEYSNRIDGRPGVILFAFNDVREPVDEVSRVLAALVGPRFVYGVPGHTGV